MWATIREVKEELTKKDIREYIERLKKVKTSTILKEEMIKINLETEYKYMIKRADPMIEALKNSLEHMGGF